MESPSESKRRLFEDVRIFACAVIRHWRWWVSTVLGGAFLSLYQGGGGVIPTWGLLLITGSGLFAAAFLAWRDQVRKCDADRKELESQISELTTERDELNSRLDDRAKQRQINQQLGNYLAGLEARKQMMLSLPPVDYMKTLWPSDKTYTPAAFSESMLHLDDTYLTALLQEISEFIRISIGEGKAELFLNRTELKYSPPKVIGGLAATASTQRDRFIELLDHHAKNLKKIIEMRG